MRFLALFSPLTLFAANILVTGGAGYIGSQTCKELQRAGHNPVTYDNLVRGHRHNVRFGPFVEGDIQNEDLLVKTMAEHQIDAVIHFAAYTDVGESVSDPAKYYGNNTVGTFHLLQAMRRARVDSIVFSSTCAVYGNIDSPKDLPMKESLPRKPLSPYGWSKMMSEQMIEDYQAYGLSHVIFRYFNAGGADLEGQLGEEHEPANHLIPIVFDVALKKRDYLLVFGDTYPTPDGTGVRDYISVVDLAKAHVLAVDHLLKKVDGLTINLGTGTGYSVLDVAQEVQKVTGKKVPCVIGDKRAGDPAILVADPNKAYDCLGWRPEHSDLNTLIETEWAWRQKECNN